ncbi:hypothetical protein U91I_03494 [alpha proteobacterium U9-1i]|nr:hypothetical protein U91I_03494 [alpha proteobacterium U9-1i]
MAADARPSKDGFRNALLKIVAGLIGVSPGQLIDRDAARRRGRLVRNAALAVIATLGALALIATESRWRPLLYAQMNVERYYDVVFSEGVSGPRARSFEGARQGAEVLLNGSPIGEVTGMRIDPADPRNIILQIGVDPDAPVRSDARVELRRLGNGRIVLFVESRSGAPLLEPGSSRNAPRLTGIVHPSAQTP